MLYTASWFVQLPEGFTRVGISRSVPRVQSGYRRLMCLRPGPWFKSVSPGEYLERFQREVLDPLEPQQVADQLFALGEKPVMLCYESAADIGTGKKFCHRHLVARWLEIHLDTQVMEVGHPELDRFALFTRLELPLPDIRPPAPDALLLAG